MKKADILKQIDQPNDCRKTRCTYFSTIDLFMWKAEKWQFIVGRDKESEQMLIQSDKCFKTKLNKLKQPSVL